ncbi:MAG: DegT/DnrJ/EryC1/StrS family aminotransferase [Flavobacteriales bacterium]|nr:DegT/DnrJ/EryC1/StrS family aminotransferase [Flavobacteriales bacterium]
MIPFVDLKRQYENHKAEIDEAIGRTISNTDFVGGSQVTEFEQSFAKLLDVNFCVSVGNGTDAIYIALKMLGIGVGDEVITVANSWIASSETITQTGAKVVFADIEPEQYTIDPVDVEAKISPKTKAVVVVHLHGNVADMDALTSICRSRGLYLIEDCAQAHLSEYKGKCVGTFGDAGTFSFYPSKNLGAYGHAGAVVTNNSDLAQRIRTYSNHGALNKYDHVVEGINSRLDSIQAAVLNVKIKYIEHWNEQRRKIAKRYSGLLSKVNQIQLPVERTDCKHTYHLYVIRCLERREELRSYLEDRGIQTALHYPTILPLLPAYGYLNYCGTDFPIAFEYQHQILSLPMFPEMRDDEVISVSEAIVDFYDSTRS